MAEFVEGRDPAGIEAFGNSLGGELIRAGDAGYDAARRVYNLMIDKRPALIVRCGGVADVISAVNYARERQIPVSVRSGGHNVAGNAICENGLVIDLSRLKGIRVDPAARTVRAQAGVTYAELDRETQAFDLAAPGGTVSSTGIAGLTLGGGFGWLQRQHGLACDNLLSVDIVTADGQMWTASAQEHADLFWAIQGGGANFGVVTCLEYRLHPVATVLAGAVVHPVARAVELGRFFSEFTKTTPDALTPWYQLARTPDGHALAMIMACYNGPPTDGESALQPLREFGAPLAVELHPMPYRALQSMLDPAFAPMCDYWKSCYLSGLSEALFETLAAHFAEANAPTTAIVIEQMGGAIARVSPQQSAFSHRDAPYNLLIVSRWSDPAERETHIAWTRRLWQALRPFAAGGAYINYMSGGEPEDEVRAAYGANYERLAALKRQYDPANLFRSNQNIPPATYD